MIFRQLFDRESCTYTYLLADDVSRKAILIDPVLEQMPVYEQLLTELDLQLAVALDTHVHADHITALGKLQLQFNCETLHGEHSLATGISRKVCDGETIQVGSLELLAMYTPGHTADSYSFLLKQEPCWRVFTGDTLLIRGSGRTDFQSGCALQQYHSITEKLWPLPGNTRVYPGHDYRGLTVSTIAEEKQFNPRLQVSNAHAYMELMESLNLDPPKKMDVAVPSNLNAGLTL
ncbi:MBL fold metallo-hydrolase [Aestuariicella sp. G3-2]|uniref:MBL fold metallo-hydrolase n=1 Tax=Pseudomaricurvus albidus TaxID=2842452 RepID=UPI001C0B2939|nr:MBL fold metallo-hydrolase [Aestuariicella albida]MBU3070934.1 MBL fold metallo-hydrolase [Aestuariicella albida]